MAGGGNTDGEAPRPPHPLPSDAELLARYVRNRDPNAFAAIVARHQRLVMGVALRQVGDRHRAEDVFQATFLVLAERAHRIRRPQALACWLHGTARRIGLRALADLARQTAMSTSATSSASAATPLFLSEPAADQPILHEMQQAFERQVLDAELANLPEKLRLPLVLHYLEGLTGREVAHRLGVSVETVEGRLKQGRNRLRERLVRHGVGFSVATAAFHVCESSAVAAAATLVEATTAASLAWVNHQPLEACTANAARLAGKELAAMTAAKTTLLTTWTAIVCLGTGMLGALTLGAGSGPPGGGGVAGRAVDASTSSAATGSQPSESVDGITLTAEGGQVVRGGATGELQAGTVTLAGLVGETEGGLAGAAPGRQSYALWPQSREIVETALDQPSGGLEFKDAIFSDVLAFFGERFAVPVRIDTTALEELGFDADVSLTNLLIPSAATAREALELVLEEVSAGSLDYIVRHGVLTITSREKADEFMETVVYELRDLGPNFPAEDVVELVHNGTSGPWMDIEGTGGTVSPLPGGILVRQSQRGHREVVQLLDQLRQFASRQDLPQVERTPRPLDPFFGPGFSGGGAGHEYPSGGVGGALGPADGFGGGVEPGAGGPVGGGQLGGGGRGAF